MRSSLTGLALALSACVVGPPPPASPAGSSGPPGAYGEEGGGAEPAEEAAGGAAPGGEPSFEGQAGAELEAGAEVEAGAELEAGTDVEAGAGRSGGAVGTSPDDGAAPLPASQARGSGGMASFEAGVAAAINRLRRDPRGLAGALQRHRQYYRGRYLDLPGVDAPILTFEGVAAVDEAIAAARRAHPRPALRISRGLSRAARAHAVEIGRAGTVDHQGRDGSEPLERMERHGRVMGLSGENIGTGWGGAQVMVLSLFIDDGIRNRGHRVNLLEADYRTVGVGCARHRRFGTVCVLDFAAEFRE